MVSDTTPSFVQAGLLPALYRALDSKQASAYQMSLVLQIVHKVTHTSFGAGAVMGEKALSQAIVQAAVAEISNWCITELQGDAALSKAGTADSESRAGATDSVTHAVLILAQLLEAGTTR